MKTLKNNCNIFTTHKKQYTQRPLATVSSVYDIRIFRVYTALLVFLCVCVCLVTFIALGWRLLNSLYPFPLQSVWLQECNQELQSGMGCIL